ncbi:uncharacterized protein LOC111408626 [Olea europaea var. sylvestris]|uniref:uncharacterized protein LOC111408626 n=1 Tax=Olea europaea var. sylvestris TaxID=158386 RepID=UPI000C1D3235|nr:uncharacterized protein LOC111408626 [Olea europaea var. sylvestris]
MATKMEFTGDNSTPHSSSPLKIRARGKTDIAWGHCKEILEASNNGNKNKKKLVCLYCGKTFAGGGINRVKQHLAGMKGDVDSCRKVPPDVRFKMKENLDVFAAKKCKTQEILDEYLGDDDDVQEIFPPNSKGKGTVVGKNERKERGIKHLKQQNGIGSYFMPRTGPGNQPTIKSVLQSKEAIEKCDLTLSKWMIDSCIPFNAVNYVYYQQSIDAIASMGPSYKGPNFHSLRGYLLAKNVKEVQNYVESYRSTWKTTGCTIMADGWTDQCRRTLINFLVYCPKGTIFLKSVDASNESKSANMLYKLFRDVVLFVGSEYVVHMVTDNAANYVAASRLLEQEFQTLFWSPCVAHCINLMFHDIGKLDEVSNIVSQASKITTYIYNHCYPLHLMRKFTGGKEILRPAPTCFTTNFIALQSILIQKDPLRAMVTSREWTLSAYAKESKGKRFVDDVLDPVFWKECATIVQLTEPLVRVLRIVDSDEKPSMGYLYEAIHVAKSEMEHRFQRRKNRIAPYLQIIQNRWDSQLRKNLHAAGYWLNPSFQYDNLDMENHKQTILGLLDVIERYAYDQPDLRSKLTGEMRLFRQAQGDFGRLSAVADRHKMAPDEWWMCYGSSTPNLQTLAIRVLSQTCSSSGCERNWRIISRVEIMILSTLVIGIYGNWVLEEEPPTLVEDELEVFRRELGEYELHFDDLDLDDCENFGNGNENTSDTNNGNEDFSMTETPSFIQGEGIEEFMSETPAWMRSNSS